MAYFRILQMIGLLVLLLLSSAAADTHLTQAQVIQIAAAFCQHVGQPVTVSGTAQYPAPTGDIEETYWQQRWHVTFPGQAEVEVVDATGNVCMYENSVYDARIDETPAGTAISQAQAMQVATTALNATGLADQVTFWQARPLQLCTPPMAKSYKGEALWHRSLQGVPYLYQHLTIDMDAQTGELTGLLAMFPSPPAPSAAMSINQETAISNSQAALVNTGIWDATLQGVKPEIARINTQPLSPGQELQPGIARVAWRCSYLSGAVTYDEWVDGVTGEVISGSGSEPGGLGGTKTAAKALSVMTALKTASGAALGMRDSKENWKVVPASTLSRLHEPRLYALLKMAHPISEACPGGIADYKLILTEKNGSVQEDFLYPQAGLIGKGSDWAVMPPAFNAWAKQEAAATKK